MLRAVAAVAAAGTAEGVDDELSTSQLGLSLGAADSAVGILDNDVQLDARAAKAIVARKNGPEGRELAADDRPFASIGHGARVRELPGHRLCRSSPG